MASRAQSGAGLTVLVSGDDAAAREALAGPLRALGCAVSEVPASTLAAGRERRAFDLALLDLGGVPAGTRGDRDPASPLTVLPALLSSNPRLEIVVVAEQATVTLAEQTIRRGAHDYLRRPVSEAQLRQLVERTAARRRLERQVVDLRSQLAQSAPEIDLETRSPRMRALLGVLGHAAAHDVAVLLVGESGTGKSVLARRLHALSSRRGHPLVVVNCAALPEEQLGSALFGHAPGAFPWAAREQPGGVESAAGGTLFLDEVAELPPSLQARLLRLLDDGEYQRAGERQVRQGDVRVVAATNRDLATEVAAGRFREDLMMRLDTVVIHAPPLRERPEDILPLARRFLAFFGRIAPRAPLELTPAAEQVLREWPWPGNIRELRNAIESAVIVAGGPLVGPELLPERMAPRRTDAPSVGGDFTLEELAREHTLRVTARTESLDEAAAILGLDPQALWRLRKKYEGR